MIKDRGCLITVKMASTRLKVQSKVCLKVWKCVLLNVTIQNSHFESGNSKLCFHQFGRIRSTLAANWVVMLWTFCQNNWRTPKLRWCNYDNALKISFQNSHIVIWLGVRTSSSRIWVMSNFVYLVSKPVETSSWVVQTMTVVHAGKQPFCIFSSNADPLMLTMLVMEKVLKEVPPRYGRVIHTLVERKGESAGPAQLYEEKAPLQRVWCTKAQYISFFFHYRKSSLIHETLCSETLLLTRESQSSAVSLKLRILTGFKDLWPGKVF